MDQGGYPPPPGGQPGYDQAGYDQPWQPPISQPRAKRGSAKVIVAVFVAVLLAAGAGTGIYFYLSSQKKSSTAGSPNPSAGTGKSTKGPSSAPGSAGPSGGPGDAATAKEGDCLVNNGTSDKPNLRKSASCAKDTFKVLKRIDGTFDTDKCKGVPGYSHNYFFKTKSPENSFVLCMKLN